MDPVTHAALGALAGAGVQRVTGNRNTPSRTEACWIGAGAGLFPDIDILTFWIDPLSYHAFWHGTYTHSLILAPFWAFLYAAGIQWLLRRRGRQPAPEPSMRVLSLISLLGILSHIAADTITAWSVGIGAPFGFERVSFGLLFVVDPLFTGAILITLWALWQARSRLALIALIGAVFWISFAGVQKQQAVRIGEAITQTETSVQAWPQPFSVFHWLLVHKIEEGYAIAYLRTNARAPLRWPLQWMERTAQSYGQPSQLTWEQRATTPHPQARAVWGHDDFATVRAFMTYPIYWETDEDDCVWFTDALFVLPTQPPPFLYGGCLDHAGQLEVARKPVAPPWGRP